MHKIFPHTHDGDQISISFDHIEEKDAFQAALEIIRAFLESTEPEEKEGGKEIWKNRKLKTTLQAEVASCKVDQLISILGVRALNVYGKDDVWIVRYAEQVK